MVTLATVCDESNGVIIAVWQPDTRFATREQRGEWIKVSGTNIGKSYAIHGTANPASTGSRASHGCIRTANANMEHIFNMMDVGDPLYITE